EPTAGSVLPLERRKFRERIVGTPEASDAGERLLQNRGAASSLRVGHLKRGGDRGTIVRTQSGLELHSRVCQLPATLLEPLSEWAAAPLLAHDGGQRGGLFRARPQVAAVHAAD